MCRSASCRSVKVRFWGKIAIFCLALGTSAAQGGNRYFANKTNVATYNEIVSLENLVPSAYPAIRDVSLEILRRFPPDQYYLVGLGRSPAPVMAFLEEYGIKEQTTVPISHLKDYAKVSFPEGDAKLRTHFRKFLPTEAELHGRKVLLIDYVHTGDSLAKAAELIQEIFPSTGIEAFALGHTPFQPKLRIPFHRSFEQPDDEFTELFRRQKFDRWAKYKEYEAPFTANGDSQPAKFNSDYRHLETAIKKEMEKDETLRAFRLKACSSDFAHLR